MKKQIRLDTWTELRNAATCLEDVPLLLEKLPEFFYVYYRSTYHGKSKAIIIPTLTMVGKPSIELQSITHCSPLGHPTNWSGQDKSKTRSSFGLRTTTIDNFSHVLYSAQNESGISISNDECILFANDWPFVAKMILEDAFNKKLTFPRVPTNSGDDADAINCLDELNRYSNTFVGMPYDALCELRNTLGLTHKNLRDMMQQQGEKTWKKPLDLALPQGIEDDTPPNCF